MHKHRCSFGVLAVCLLTAVSLPSCYARLSYPPRPRSSCGSPPDVLACTPVSTFSCILLTCHCISFFSRCKIVFSSSLLLRIARISSSEALALSDVSPCTCSTSGADGSMLAFGSPLIHALFLNARQRKRNARQGKRFVRLQGSYRNRCILSITGRL